MDKGLMIEPQFLKYYIRVTNVRIFDAIVASAEEADVSTIDARREGGYYVLRTNDQTLWRELFLYGQMLAQAQGEFFEAGED